MNKLPWHIALAVLLMGLIAACSMPFASPASKALPPAADPSVTGVPPSSPELPPAELVLVDLKDDATSLRGRPIDAQSLADVPGRLPIDFGHHFVQAVSQPDGKVLAVIAWPNGYSNGGAVLHLIDLTSWSDSLAHIKINDNVNGLTFGAKGQELFWLIPERHDGAHDMPRDYELVRYDLASGNLDTITRLPTAFMPWPVQIRVLRSGSQLAIYGIPTDVNNLSEDVPHVLIVDLPTGHISADVKLEGVKAGQFHLTPPEGDGYRMAEPGLAWDLARNRLYVVHADEDKVTVVDLAQGKILKQTGIRSHQSLWERLLSTFASVAQAKPVPTTSKCAVLSPDATRLYIVGTRADTVSTVSRQWAWRAIPLGLQVLATEDLTQIRQLDLPVGQLAVAPDGGHLVLATAEPGFGAEQTVRLAHQLYLVDTERFDTLMRTGNGEPYALHAFSPDGQYAYVSHAVRGSTPADWKILLEAMTMKTPIAVRQREVKGGFAMLLSISELQRQIR